MAKISKNLLTGLLWIVTAPIWVPALVIVALYYGVCYAGEGTLEEIRWHEEQRKK